MNRDVATKCRAGPECTWEVSVLDGHVLLCVWFELWGSPEPGGLGGPP